MRRCLAVVTSLALLLGACTSDDADPGSGDGEPSRSEEDETEAEDPVPSGLRVGVVLPPRDTGTADEVEAGPLGIDGLARTLGDAVAEVRTIVPDASAFVPDVAGLLVAEDYDVVCVVGRDARETVLELARRHVATDFCGAPVAPVEDAPDNLHLADLALAELGHVVGVALGELGGDEPVALLGSGNRAGGELFRSGLRAGVGETPLHEARGEREDLEDEIAGALADDVAAIAVDAGPDAAEAVDGIEGVALLAPAPLLTEEDPGALRWRVRWEVVLEQVLRHLLDDEEELPETFGLAEGVFAVDQGAQASAPVVAAVEAAMGELERGVRDPRAAPEPDDDEDDDGDGEAEGDDEDADPSPAEDGDPAPPEEP